MTLEILPTAITKDVLAPVASREWWAPGPKSIWTLPSSGGYMVLTSKKVPPVNFYAPLWSVPRAKLIIFKGFTLKSVDKQKKVMGSIFTIPSGVRPGPPPHLPLRRYWLAHLTG